MVNWDAVNVHDDDGDDIVNVGEEDDDSSSGEEDGADSGSPAGSVGDATLIPGSMDS
jgi:hypothetical protein